MSATGVALIFYYFAAVFTKKKLYKLLFVLLMSAMCVFIYYEINHPRKKVVRMKEDVLYILPKSDTLKK